MKFHVMTLFPELIENVLGESIIGRAIKDGYISLDCYNIRDFSEDKHRKTDDTPFGGGVGMVMTCQPIYDCYENVIRDIPDGNKKRVIYMSPRGRMFNHEVAKELSQYDNLIFLCTFVYGFVYTELFLFLVIIEGIFDFDIGPAKNFYTWIIFLSPVLTMLFNSITFLGNANTNKLK